ncbi:MAG: hypothetical protein MRZ79_12560 [Bacteroidia bacterium]|nr:hypothetical protein [Bacteroidia bacterium]
MKNLYLKLTSPLSGILNGLTSSLLAGTHWMLQWNTWEVFFVRAGIVITFLTAVLALWERVKAIFFPKNPRT